MDADLMLAVLWVEQTADPHNETDAKVFEVVKAMALECMERRKSALLAAERLLEVTSSERKSLGLER